MTSSTFFLREPGTPSQSAPDHRGFFNTTCKPGISWVKWCPVDIALWVLLFCIVLLVCWKVYITNRVGPNSPGQRKRSNRNLHCRLELPQTEELLDSSEQHYCTYEYKLESGQLHESVPYDDTLDNPPIPNSVPQFNHSATPKHDANSRGPYANGIGLGINVNLNHDLPLPQHLESPETTTWVEKIEKDVNAKIMTPDPVYIRRPHWDP